jgi:hypothetical protein
MRKTFDTVDSKVAEAEFFLRKMAACRLDFEEFGFYFSAFLAASRTVTLALQQFSHLDGFVEWYAPHQMALKMDQTAKFFLNTRNSHLHGGEYPIRGGSSFQGIHKFHFRDYEHNSVELGDDDILTRSRSFFLTLIEIVYDCYVHLGPQIDPQQYFTAEHFSEEGRNIDDAEFEVYGWVMESLKEEGFIDDDRWSELRAHVECCKINHLFHAYLGLVTPQPKEPEHYQDFEPSEEDRGWTHIPAGFETIEEWIEFVAKTKNAHRSVASDGDKPSV